MQGALVDVYVATENMHLMEDFILQEIIEHIFYNGVVVQNNGYRFVNCIRDYVYSREMDTIAVISRRVNFSALASHIIRQPTSTIDYRNPSFYIPALSLLGTLMSVLLLGCTVQKVMVAQRGRKGRAAQTQQHKLLTLKAWRMEYKAELYDVVTGIFNDLMLIQRKSDDLGIRWRETVENHPTSPCSKK